MCESQGWGVGGAARRSLQRTVQTDAVPAVPDCLVSPVWDRAATSFPFPSSSRVKAATRPVSMVSFGLCALDTYICNLKDQILWICVASTIVTEWLFSCCWYHKAKRNTGARQTLQDSVNPNLWAELYQKSSPVCYEVKSRNTCLTGRSQLSLQYWEHQQEKRGREFVNRAKQMKLTEMKIKMKL